MLISAGFPAVVASSLRWSRWPLSSGLRWWRRQAVECLQPHCTAKPSTRRWEWNPGPPFASIKIKLIPHTHCVLRSGCSLWVAGTRGHSSEGHGGPIVIGHQVHCCRLGTRARPGCTDRLAFLVTVGGRRAARRRRRGHARCQEGGE